jgi:hypothetical protein
MVLVAILAVLAATCARACDTDWGNDQFNENDYE